jgi:hypothetical protein
MSTDFHPIKDIPASDLLDGRLEEFGVYEHFNAETDAKKRMLTDGGGNFLWLYVDDAGLISCLTRYFPNGNPDKILDAIADAFDTEIVSEYESQFWGFDTHEEWDARQRELSQEYEEEFHNDILKFLRGEPNDIGAGTIGMIKAQIAKKLVENDAALLLPDNKEKFRAEIQSIYVRDHTVELSELIRCQDEGLRPVPACAEPRTGLDARSIIEQMKRQSRNKMATEAVR